MRKIDYSEYVLELADKIHELATDLQKTVLKERREKRARSARGGFALLRGGRASGRGDLAETLEGQAELVAVEAEE